jgi:O-antigen ligase
LRVLQLGLVVVALVALPYRVFELDRYFVPKELALHVVAVVLAAWLVARRRSIPADRTDALLAIFLGWSLLSAAFATNHWLAQRALAISASSLAVYWAARSIGASGRHRELLGAAALACVVATATGLAQAYGMDVDWFSRNRAPGGTFGNRNFVAHFAVIGLPALVYTVLVARTKGVAFAGTMGVGAVAALLVLTRSRAAWLAAAVAIVVALGAMMFARTYWRGGLAGGRLARIALAVTVFVAASIVFPNTLNWRSENPYLDTATRVVDYSSGSGRGRLAQYRNSLSLAMDDPLLGAGPGNWPVRYVRFAPSRDQSLTDDGMTANPWPSSDWVAFLSERGAIATVALLAAFAMSFFGAFRRWPVLAHDDAVLGKIALAATIAALAVVSAFDAVLLLAAPAILAWTVIGAASGIGTATPDPAEPRWWRPVLLGTLALSLLGVIRSGAQVASIQTVREGGTIASWVNAARWDPGSYRIALRAAELQANRGRCPSARVHAQRARALFPNAAAPRRVLRRCGGR